MFAEFLGIRSKNMFHGNPLLAHVLFFRKKLWTDRETDRLKVANTPFLQIVFRR